MILHYSEYGTVSEAINNFKKQGFTIDFNLTENCFVCDDNNKYALEEFEIIEMYRYDGSPEPGDDAIIYALESKSGLKGILMTEGIYSDQKTQKMIDKLEFRK